MCLISSLWRSLKTPPRPVPVSWIWKLWWSRCHQTSFGRCFPWVSVYICLFDVHSPLQVCPTCCSEWPSFTMQNSIVFPKSSNIVAQVMSSTAPRDGESPNFVASIPAFPGSQSYCTMVGSLVSLYWPKKFTWCFCAFLARCRWCNWKSPTPRFRGQIRRVFRMQE